jgi:Protein of unknown function (DUF2637)
MTAVPRARARQVAEFVTAAGLGLLVVVGFVASYETLRDLAATEAGFSPWLAPLVPLSFDLGIVILSLRVVLAAHEGRTATVTRLLVATLAMASVAANVAAATTVTGQLLHAVPPAMFVVCFETVIVAARRHALQRLGLRPAVSPRFRPLVWVLAPRATWTAWRDAVLGSGPRVAAGPQPHPGVTDVRPTSALRPHGAAATAAPGLSARGNGRRHDDRHAVAVRVVGLAPDITAASLAAELSRHGHPVSVRTAQRVRATAMAVLGQPEAVPVEGGSSA